MLARIIPIVLAIGSLSGCSPQPVSGDPQPVKFAEDRGGKSKPAEPAKFAEDRDTKPMDSPFDGERCLKYLKQICDLGPRISGSNAMIKQQELLIKHFEGLGGVVRLQKFDARQNSQPGQIPMANLIVSYFPDRKTRLLLSAHYDTRPYADQDIRANWNKPFVSANDGGSGIALFMELAHHLPKWPAELGVDLVLFDGEEYVFNDQDAYFLGSRHFAADYVKQKKCVYRSALNFDMIGHPNARLCVEGYSLKNAQALVTEVWELAAKLKAKSFRFERGFNRAQEVLDDHIPLQEVGIPAIDIIDFDYEHWHKISDTPDKCSASQLAEVGMVTLAWLKLAK